MLSENLKREMAAQKEAFRIREETQSRCYNELKEATQK